MNQIICVTSQNKLIKFDAKNGHCLATVPKIHKNSTDSLSVTNDGRYLITSGDNLVKIWDYEMRLEKNFQAFIGHSSAVNCILYTPDHNTIITVGDSIIYWDFLAYVSCEERELIRKLEMPKGRALEEMRDLPVSIVAEFKKKTNVVKKNQRTKSTDSKPSMKNPGDIRKVNVLNEDQFEALKANKKASLTSKSLTALKSTVKSSEESFKTSSSNSAIHWSSNVSFEKPRTPPIAAEIQIETIAVNGEIEDTFLNDELTLLESNSSMNSNQKKFPNLPNFITSEITSMGQKELPSDQVDEIPENEPIDELKEINEQTLYKKGLEKHLSIRKKPSHKSKRRYLAPTDQCGLKLNSIIGYNGKYANKNMVWSPELDLFAFTCGTIVCVEDLKTGKQTLLYDDQEDVTVLTLRNDSLQMASASALLETKSSLKASKQSQITIWNCETFKVVTKLIHKSVSFITNMSFSHDDRFLISIGDYQTPSFSIWGTFDYSCLVSMDNLNCIINDIAWNPCKCNEFALCGANKMLVVWTLAEKPMKKCSLKSYECEMPLSISEVIHFIL